MSRRRLLQRFVAYSVQQDLEYRAGFAINAFNTLMGLASSIAVLLALLRQGGSIGGWDINAVTVLLGVFTFCDATVSMVFRPSLRKIAEYIELGSMDYVLLKPVNLQFAMSLRAWSLWNLPNIMIGIALIGIGMARAGTLTIEHAAMAILGLMSGVTVLYALWAIVTVSAFWFVRISNAQMLLYALMGAARYPASIYPTGLRLVFTLALPIVFITNIPAAAAVGLVGWPMIGAGCLVAALTFALSLLIWRQAVRHYTSASS